ncbi:ABC transporter ATP-binding protein [Telluribacter humicola]|uniref:ABC transporter ATP-binding protein n=1 Tax=Telluribacter humicola TaxID=1720261 RepID=UPI001A96F970|nr:ABC transporter ATP-binding protein [Telluribacter humicola]
MKDETTLHIKNVSKAYPNGVKALQNISLTIPAGMYGLLGPNGAGKSSLMRTLATLQDPDEGSIFFGKIDVLKDKEELQRTLGYLPQDFGLHPNARAEELLNYFAIMKGVREKKSRREVVEALLKQTNLWDLRNQKLGGFSGGMRQRFGIAIVMLGNPKLIIVDEPTAGLDPAERVRFLNLLSEMGENSVVILSTHIVEDVSELCTRMAVINKGEILMETEPLQAIVNLKGKIWRKVVQKDQLSRLEQEHIILSTKLSGGRTVAHIYSEGFPGNDFEEVLPDLEDVYFQVITQHSRNNVSHSIQEVAK